MKIRLFPALLRLALLCCAALPLLCSCGEDFPDYSEEIVGVWRSEEGEDRYDVYVFKSDGTGSYELFVGGRKAYGADFTYFLEENKLIRRVGGDEVREDVSIKGGTLRLRQGRYEALLKKVPPDKGGAS